MQVTKNQTSSKKRVHFADHEEVYNSRPIPKMGRTLKDQTMNPFNVCQKLNWRKIEQVAPATTSRCNTWSPRPHRWGQNSKKDEKPLLGQLEDNRFFSLNQLRESESKLIHSLAFGVIKPKPPSQKFYKGRIRATTRRAIKARKQGQQPQSQQSRPFVKTEVELPHFTSSMWSQRPRKKVRLADLEILSHPHLQGN